MVDAGDRGDQVDRAACLPDFCEERRVEQIVLTDGQTMYAPAYHR
jgi:hypothetical protein